MSRRIQSKEDSDRTTSDGTAARTRPLSIQDIMLRREKKAASETKKTKEGLQDNDKGNSNHLEPGRGYKSRKDLKDMPVEGSKKESIRDTPSEGYKKDNLKRTPREGPKKENMGYTPSEGTKKDSLKDRPKDGSKMDDLKDTLKVSKKDKQKDTPKKGSKKERSSVRGDSQLADNDKGIVNSHKLSTSMRSWVGESKDGNRGEIGARNGHVTRSELQKEPGTRWHDETVDNDRINERSEKLRNETKRKGRDFDDGKSSEIDRSVLKKHDSGRFQDSKHSDRNDWKKDYAKPYHEEPRSKRRRSRSRDNVRERHDRSVSLSPREQRHSYRGHDYDNYPLYYSMDKSRRKYAETDRHRTSGNDGYSGGSYRRHGSRLGGYSPRKRKTGPKAEQATTKTPSPIARSPEKKSATWDQPPAGADQSSFFTTLQPTVSQMASSVPVNFTALKQDPVTTLETILAGNSLAVDSVQLTQATRPFRRLYIENLPGSATENMLIDCLNDFLLSSGVNHAQRSKPCLSCTINKEKRQAFVEFLTPEDATAALSFNGRSFNGSALKIRRPKEYVESANVAPEKPAEETKVISDVVADSRHKIFIAGISGVISSDMLMEIASAFGPLAAYRFLFNEELGGPCAFLEYIDHSITSNACAGLNGMKLGGCILTAVHVFPNPPEEVHNEASPFYGIPANAKSLLEEPTKVLQLKDVFDREEFFLLSKSELEETLEDVRMECARFGAVKSINVSEYPASCDNVTEDTIVETKDGSVKIEATEPSGDDCITETGTECSVPNQGDVPGHSDPTATQDVDPIPEGQDKKELAKSLASNAGALCEHDAPAVYQHSDLDDVHARATLPTLDKHVEADHIVSEVATCEDKRMETDHHITTVDDPAVGKERTDPRTLETCSSCTPGDETQESKRENEQQGATDTSQGSAEKVPTVDTRGDALACDTNVFEPGSILVEFMRKEATCMAAHSLHGRRFGNKTVSAGYAPHDLYLQRYPR